MRRFLTTCLFALLPCVFLILMTAVPLWEMLHYQDHTWQWRDMIHDDFYRRRFIWTFFQAACTSFLAIILALPMGWSLARLDFWGKRWIIRLMLLPFIMPSLVAGMGVLALFGEQGLLWRGWTDTPYLLIYGNLFFNLPIAILAAQQGFQAVPANQLAAAQTFGANAWQRFYYLELPILKNWLLGASCLIFLYCFSGFSLALLLGGQQYATLEVEIYQLIAYELDMSRAAVLVWCVLGITALTGVALAWFSRREAVGKPISRQPEKPKSGWQKLILLISLMIWLMCCMLPLWAMVFQAALLPFTAWQIVWHEDTLFALKNTLTFTAITIFTATIFGISHAAWAKRARWVRSITFLPLMISPVCLAFGVLLVYPQYADQFWLLMSLYALLAYPFVAKDVLAKWDSLPTHYTQMAHVFGANRFQAACLIILPLLRPALRRGMTLAAATSIGEFAATLFLARPEWLTLNTLIYQKLGKIGTENYHHAMVLTTLLMLLASLIFVLIDKQPQSP